MLYFICDASLLFQAADSVHTLTLRVALARLTHLRDIFPKKASTAELLCIGCSLSHLSALTATRLVGCCLLRTLSARLEVCCISKVKAREILEYLSLLPFMLCLYSLFLSMLGTIKNVIKMSFERQILTNKNSVDVIFRPFQMLILSSYCVIIRLFSYGQVFILFKLFSVCFDFNLMHAILGKQYFNDTIDYTSSPLVTSRAK